MNKHINWLVRSNIFLYSISLCAITFIIKGLVHAFKCVLKIPDIQFRERLVNENLDITIDFVIDTLIIAPVLETLVFQTLFFLIFKRFKINIFIIVLVSGVFFGFFHNYSVFYMIDASLIGFIFMYLYILRAKVDNKPLVSTIIAHLSINLSVIITIFITRYYKYEIYLENL